MMGVARNCNPNVLLSFFIFVNKRWIQPVILLRYLTKITMGDIFDLETLYGTSI